jgi:hypothetical protein
MAKLHERWRRRWSLRCVLLATLVACRVPAVAPLHSAEATPTLQVWLTSAPSLHDSLRYEVSLLDVPIAWVAIETASATASEIASASASAPSNANVSMNATTTTTTSTDAATVIRATMQLAGATRALFDANVNDTSTLSATGELLRSTVDVIGTLNSHCYAAIEAENYHGITTRQDFDDGGETRESVWLTRPPLTISAWLLALQHWPLDKALTTESLLVMPDCQFARVVATQRQRAVIATAFGNRRAVRLEVQTSLTGFTDESHNHPVAVSIWLSDDADQWPLLITAATPLGQARAELLP